MNGLRFHVRSWVSHCTKLVGQSRHGSRTIWDSGVSIVFKVFGGIANLVFISVMARFLGPGNMGLFFLTIIVITLGAIVGRLGMDNAVLRFAAQSASRNEWVQIHALYRRSITVVLVTSIFVALGLYLLAPWISSFIFSKPELTSPLRIMVISIVPLSILYLHAELLKGLRKIRQASLLEGVFVPVIATVVLVIVWLMHGLLGYAPSIISATAIYCGAAVVSTFIGIYFWHQGLPAFRSPRAEISASKIIKSSMPMLWITTMNMVMGWTDTFMLGILMNKDAVGRYAVASRMAMLISFILMAVNSVLAPRFAALYASSDHNSLGRLANGSAKITTALAVPITLVFVLFPEQVLALFGRGFAAAGPALAILAIGQFVNVATGSVGYLLMMSGHEKDYRNCLVLVALLNIAMNWVLIRIYGIEGAAFATACSVIALNVISAIFVYKRLSIMTLPIPKIFRIW